MSDLNNNKNNELKNNDVIHNETLKNSPQAEEIMWKL